MFKLGLLSNRWLLTGVVVTICLQMLFTYAPPMQRLFQTAAIGPIEWAAITVFGGLVFVVIGVEKWFRKYLASRAMS